MRSGTTLVLGSALGAFVATIAGAPFIVLATLLGLVAGSFASAAICRLPVEDSVGYEPVDEPGPELRWWYHLPFVWLFVDPPDGEPISWYERLPLVPTFVHAWASSDFSMLWPRSACRVCRRPFGASERLPLLSGSFVTGCCSGRECDRNLHRPVGVELVVAGLFALFAHRFGPTWILAAASFLATTFVIVAVIDWRHQIIPDEINSLGLACGLAFAGLTQAALACGLLSGPDRALQAACIPWRHSDFGLGSALLGAVTGAAALECVALLGLLLARTEAMGGGDVKLAAFIGAFLGPQGVLVTLYLAMLLGAMGGLAILVFGGGRRQGGFTRFAFGPFIVLAAGFVLYHGPAYLVHAYLSLNTVLVAWL